MVSMGTKLPHGFHKVIVNESDDAYHQMKLTIRAMADFTHSQRNPATMDMPVGQIPDVFFFFFCQKCLAVCSHRRDHARLQYTRQPYRNISAVQ